MVEKKESWILFIGTLMVLLMISMAGCNEDDNDTGIERTEKQLITEDTDKDGIPDRYDMFPDDFDDDGFPTTIDDDDDNDGIPDSEDNELNSKYDNYTTVRVFFIDDIDESYIGHLVNLYDIVPGNSYLNPDDTLIWCEFKIPDEKENEIIEQIAEEDEVEHIDSNPDNP